MKIPLHEIWENDMTNYPSNAFDFGRSLEMDSFSVLKQQTEYLVPKYH